MFPITHINSVTIPSTMSACLSILGIVSFVFPTIIGRNSMFSITNVLCVPNSSTKVTNGFCSINRTSFGFKTNICHEIVT